MDNVSMYWEEPGWATLNVNGTEISLQASVDWTDPDNPIVDQDGVKLIFEVERLIHGR